jgi:hypothetical protein
VRAAVKSHYDFRIGPRVAGSFVIEDDGAELRQAVSFETDAGERYENRHAVRYDGHRALAYRVAGGEWIDCSTLPADHYPTAAYPLVIRHGLAAYVAIDEETGGATPRTLEWSGDQVVEREAGRTTRTFEVRDGAIVRIDWGGATSTLLEIAGTGSAPTGLSEDRRDPG